MLELLSDKQKDNIAKWKVKDTIISDQIFAPFWSKVVKWIPDYVAPNVLSLSGLILLVYSYYITYLYSYKHSRVTSLISSLLIFAYQTLYSINGEHSRNIGNSSSLCELFDYSCENLGTIFLILTTATNLGVNDSGMLFYTTQIWLMMFLIEHLKDFRNGKSTFNGPGEILTPVIVILCWKAFTGWSLIPQILLHSKFFYVFLFSIYWIVYFYCLIFTAFDIRLTDDINIFNKKTLIKLWTRNKHYGSKVGVLLCLFMRCINGVLLWYGLIQGWELQDVIAHGLVLTVVITDIIVSKMAKR